MEKMKCTRKRAPCKEEWEGIRPLLQRLYIEDRRPLEEVAERLEREHNFRAT